MAFCANFNFNFNSRAATAERKQTPAIMQISVQVGGGALSFTATVDCGGCVLKDSFEGCIFRLGIGSAGDNMFAGGNFVFMFE